MKQLVENYSEPTAFLFVMFEDLFRGTFSKQNDLLWTFFCLSAFCISSCEKLEFWNFGFTKDSSIFVHLLREILLLQTQKCLSVWF